MTAVTEAVTLVLPQPPSVDEYWKPWRGRMVMTQAGRDFRQTTWALAKNTVGRVPTFPVGPVIVYVAWFRLKRSAGDLDNRLKAILDGLQGTLYENDRQVHALVAWVVDGELVRTPRVEVRVEPWTANRVPVVMG